MEPSLHWSVWLLSGMALGLLSGLGESGVFGMLVGIGILCSPVVIYMNAGVAYLPFVLFYGGLIVVTSFLYRRKNAKRNAKLRGEIDARNKRMK